MHPENWNEACLLPNLYQALAGRRRRHTLLFIAFTDHDQRQQGSQSYLSRLTQTQIRSIAAMVDLYVLGMSPTKIWAHHSAKNLVKALVVAVYALKLPASQVDLAGSVRTDAEPFAENRVPQITIHSFTQEAASHPNDEDSLPVPFNPGAFYDSYRLIGGFLAYLDE